jgi:hypothetical protein
MQLIFNNYITHLNLNLMDYNLTCTTCEFPSMISGSVQFSGSLVSGIMCSNPPCPVLYIPIIE